MKSTKLHSSKSKSSNGSYKHIPEDIGVYLASIAKQGTQQDFSTFDNPMVIFLHRETDFFEPFAYPLVISREETSSQNFWDLEEERNPLHNIIKTDVVNKETKPVLKKS